MDIDENIWQLLYDARYKRRRLMRAGERRKEAELEHEQCECEYGALYT